MNFQSVFILLVSILSTTLGYKVDCNNSNGGCLICMTPTESTYQDKFLDTIPEQTLALGFNIDSYDSDDYEYNTINKRIKENIDQNTIKLFVEKLGKFTYKNPTNIKVVSNLSQCNGQSYD
uniref:Uncharacterized protein n=1 Tax=Strongyloides venezuelensis TaxID=75913 RepID=A0A0K0EZ29_STRVS